MKEKNEKVSEWEANKEQNVKTIDTLITNAISSIDNLIFKTEGPSGQLIGGDAASI